MIPQKQTPLDDLYGASLSVLTTDGTAIFVPI